MTRSRVPWIRYRTYDAFVPQILRATRILVVVVVPTLGPVAGRHIVLASCSAIPHLARPIVVPVDAVVPGLAISFSMFESRHLPFVRVNEIQSQLNPTFA
jgi:hypothetical protein